MSPTTPRPKKYQLPIDSDDALAAALGRMLAHWAVCEMLLAQCLASVLLIDDDQAKWIWEGFVSAKGKIALLEKLTTNAKLSDEVRNSLLDLLKKADTLNGQRNKFIHALWVGRPGELHRLRNTATAAKKHSNDIEPFTPDVVQAVVEEIAELHAGLMRWRTQHLKGSG